MASIGSTSNASSNSFDFKGNYTFPLVMMAILFFVIGFITVLNDVLIPSLKDIFELKRWQSLLIQFCFFIAYGVMSIPGGYIIKRIGYKKGLTLSLTLMGIGLFLFVPASIFISSGASMMVCYSFFLMALFIIGCGLAILQVAINPYMISLGPVETAASRINFGGALNSTATFIGPIIGAAYILPHGITDKIAKAAAVKGPYVVLALVTIAIGVVLYFIKLPKLSSEVEKGEKLKGSVWDFPNLLAGAGGIFFYVGAEVAIASILVIYLQDEHLIKIGAGAIQALTVEKAASSLVAYYWGGAMVGRIIGTYLGQKIRPEIMLRTVAFLALALVSLSISGIFLNDWIGMKVMVLIPEPFSLSLEPITFPVSILLLVLVGLCNSVMWPCIFTLGIAGLGKHTSQGSGILVTMVIGGAIIPILQGILSEPKILGYQYSFLIVLVCYLYILYYGLKGYVVKKVDENDSTLGAERKGLG